MFNTRLLSIVRKELIQITRDPRTLALVFIMPVVQLLLLGYAATTDVRNIPLAVFDQDKSPASRSLLDAYRAADYFRVEYDVNSEADLNALIGRGAARAGMIVPPGYGDQIVAGRTAQVAFVIDGSDPTVAQTALAAATLIGQAKSTRLTLERLTARGQAGGLAPPIEVRTQVWYNPDLVSAYYMIPALIGIIMQFLTVILTATAIVRERERGTIEQLIVTPIRAWELMVGKLAPYVVIAFVNTVVILVAGVLLFGVPINGSVPLLLALSALFLATTLGIGLFISTIANTQQEAMITALFFSLPSIFLSGFFFPLAAMPAVLQWISYAIPLRYFLIIVRGIVLKGVGLESLWPEVIALSIFALVIMGGAALRFRKRLD
jgi:ABC-2 type transport system permease protein